MSLKHRRFTVGQPNQEAQGAGATIKVTDDLGLSLDPAAHADPSCSTCLGRGVFFKLVGEDRQRTMTSCECSRRRYERRREIVRFQVAAASK